MENSFHNKLAQFQTTPPKGMWDKIAAQLDETTDVAQRLYQFEADPPPNAWQGIAQQLDKEQDALPVRPMRKRASIIRYSIAAAVLGLLAVSYFYTNQQNKNGTTQPVRITTGTVYAPPKNSGEDAQQIQTEIATDNSNTRSTTVAYQHTKAVNYIPKIETEGMISRSTPKLLTPSVVQRDRAIAFNPAAEKYMVYLDDEGHAVRMPKKMFDAIACATADIICKDRIKNLQQKIASAAVATDFTGVLELISNLKENN